MQEMAEAEEAAKKKRRVPKGTSTYQAAWILDDYGDDEDADEAEELVEYNSDPEEAQAPGTIAASEFAGMTEFPDEDDDAMEVCCLGVLHLPSSFHCLPHSYVRRLPLVLLVASNAYDGYCMCTFVSCLFALLHSMVRSLSFRCCVKISLSLGFGCSGGRGEHEGVRGGQCEEAVAGAA